jgi:hypothetical protein
MNSKLNICLVSLCLLFSVSVSAQKKIDGKRIKEVKEWRVEGKKRVLDQVSRYDDRSEKIEEIEYNSVGDLKRRITYEYNEAGKCIKESHYDKYNKLEKTVTFEHFENGKKKLQSTFLPNGKLSHTKEFEYILE